MKVHHLNLATMCPFGGRLVSGGDASVFSKGRIVVHALLVESSAGLVLVDTGMGLDDVKAPMKRLGVGFATMGLELREAQTAIRQVESLGFSPNDVRDIVMTHLDPDHAGGLADFAHANVHVHRVEHDAAMKPETMIERSRYRKCHLAHGPKWALKEEGGEKWLGFERVKAIADDVYLVPTRGHTRGHCAVAVRAPASSGVEWYLHCGDAYFHHGQLAEKPWCPPALDFYQRFLAADDEARRANTARLGEIHRDASRKVRLFSAHDPFELEALTSAQAASAASATAA